MSFKSWSSYFQFGNDVKSKSRFIFDHDSKSFLKAIKDTCRPRIKTIPMSQPLWRAQIGCDYIDDTPIPFEDDRMKPIVIPPFLTEVKSRG